MPISVPETPKLSTLVSWYVARLIEKHSNLEWSVLATNFLWQKVEWMNQEMIEKRLENFKMQLKDLWMGVKDLWTDRENIDSLLSIVKRLEEIWKIEEKEVKIKICNCGTCESLSCAWNFWSKKNIQNNQICSKCWSWLQEKVVKWLMYKISNKDYDIYPKRYQWHIDNYNDKYSEILISRERDTWIIYKGYYVDIDFLWSMWLSDLKNKWYLPEIVITNPSWLYNTYIAMDIFKSLNDEHIIWVVHPYIWVSSTDKSIEEEGLKHGNYSLENIIQNNEWNIAQILLATWLKFWEDYSKINESNKKTVRKLLNTLNIGGQTNCSDNYSTEEINELLKRINGKNALNAIARRIGNKYLSSEDIKNILYDFII